MPTTVTRTKTLLPTLARGANYTHLKQFIVRTLHTAEQEVERLRIQAYWQIGRAIHEHINAHADRAEYGKQVIARLASDLDRSEAVLHRVVQFARAYPNGRILAARRELTWTHYRLLLPVKNAKQREALRRQAVKEEWPARTLEAHIHNAVGKLTVVAKQSAKQKPKRRLTGKRGTLHLYTVVSGEKVGDDARRLYLDLGFEVYRPLPGRFTGNVKAGDIVSLEGREGEVTLFKRAPHATPRELFTYKAYIESIVDGDTLRVAIDASGLERIRQYLRLRGINTPEKKTAAGERARAFVARELEGEPFLIIRTFSPEKYDRYLTDVFYKGGVYLNQRLLDAGHAVRV